MTTSIKKWDSWPGIWNDATSHADAQLPACHHVPAPLPSPSLVSLRAGSLQHWLCRAGRGFRTPVLPYMCPLFPPACFILVDEDEDFGCRLGIFTHLAEGSHSSSFGQAAKNQEILAKNLKQMEFKGEGLFTQHYLLRLPSRAVLHTALMPPLELRRTAELPWGQSGADA